MRKHKGRKLAAERGYQDWYRVFGSDREHRKTNA